MKLIGALALYKMIISFCIHFFNKIKNTVSLFIPRIKIECLNELFKMLHIRFVHKVFPFLVIQRTNFIVNPVINYYNRIT